MFARLKDEAGAGVFDCDVPPGASVADVWSAATARYPSLERFGGSVTSEYAISMVRLTAAIAATGMDARIRIWQGPSLITQARNEALVQFMSDETLTHVVWIDADVGFEPDALFRLLLVDCHQGLLPSFA